MVVGIRDALRLHAKALHAEVEELEQGLAFELVLAKRRTHAALRQLRYRVVLEVHEGEGTVFFQESLWEMDEGLGGDLASRFGDREQAYRITPADAPGSVEALAARFSGYKLQVDFPQIRQGLKAVCEAEGFRLRHLQPL